MLVRPRSPQMMLVGYLENGVYMQILIWIDRLAGSGINGKFAGLINFTRLPVRCKMFAHVLVFAHHAVNRTVICGCTKLYEALTIEPESRELVTDALFRVWHDSPEYSSKSLKRRSLVIAHRGEVLVDVFRFYNHRLLVRPVRDRRAESIAIPDNCLFVENLLFTCRKVKKHFS
jgi:hypothetical protein